VIQAVQYAITALTDRFDRTAVVVVGEDNSRIEAELEISGRAAALTSAVAQAGLFLTLAAQDIVRDRLVNDVRFEDFGIHGGEETGRAERLYSVLHPDLPEPVVPHKKISGNCPRLHKSFIGRHHEIDELQDLVLNRKLVTITGSPGVGKSTTAIHVARSFDDEYEDGVWWFSVDDRASLDELLQAIASAKGLLSMVGTLSIERVAEALSQKRCVIILDGCESKVDQISSFCREVLTQSNSLTLLLTSTRSLGIPGEFIFRLNPMTLPRPGDSGEDALIGSEALSLFFERASQAGTQLALDEKNIHLAGRICERVDGLPVAIELVAASLRTSSLSKLAEELAHDLVPLSSRSFEQSDRDHALLNALLLSYSTLADEERALLHRLAFFQGEWKLNVAVELWTDGKADEALWNLHRMLDESSWIAYDPDRDTYRMLHTVRSFCWEMAGDDSRPMLDKFCWGMTAMAGRVFAELSGSSGSEADNDLSRHYSDFAFALEVCLRQPSLASFGSELMKSMVQFWLTRNLLEDAENFSTAYLESGVAGMEAARALVMLGVVRLRRGQLPEAAETLGKCLDITRANGHKLAEAATLTNIGFTMMEMANYDSAREYLRQGLEILRGTDQKNQLCGALCNAADVEVKAAAEPRLPEAKRHELYNEAEHLLKEAELLAPHAIPFTIQALWHVWGALALARGELESAETYLNRAITVCAKHGLRHEAWEATEALAEINLAKGIAPTAAKLLGLSVQIRKESGKMTTDPQTQRFGRIASLLYKQLDRNRAAKLMRYGEKLDLAEISNTYTF
jgi:predicted ATPase